MEQGNALLMQGQYRAAARAYEAALNLVETPEALYNLAHAKYQLRTPASLGHVLNHPSASLTLWRRDALNVQHRRVQRGGAALPAMPGAGVEAG